MAAAEAHGTRDGVVWEGGGAARAVSHAPWMAHDLSVNLSASTEPMSVFTTAGRNFSANDGRIEYSASLDASDVIALLAAAQSWWDNDPPLRARRQLPRKAASVRRVRDSEAAYYIKYYILHPPPYCTPDDTLCTPRPPMQPLQPSPCHTHRDMVHHTSHPTTASL